MKNFIQRLKMVPWTLGQPLTMIPKYKRTKISDLFVWRCDNNWKTFFELLNIAYLFGEDGSFQVDIIFFNTKGDIFFEKTIDLLNGDRQTLNISEILENNFESGIAGEFGTFSVFHHNIPDIVTEFNSFVTERGYVSYRYKDSQFASYVHGNLDAIGKVNQSYVPLGGTSFLKRDYNLQYQLLPDCEYDIALTNPCLNLQKVIIKILSFNNGRVIETFRVEINPKAVIVHALKDISEPCRISIESKIIMARPVVFIYKGDSMDVFHG